MRRLQVIFIAEMVGCVDALASEEALEDFGALKEFNHEICEIHERGSGGNEEVVNSCVALL